MTDQDDDALRSWADDVRANEGSPPDYDFRVGTLSQRSWRSRQSVMTALAAAAVVLVVCSVVVAVRLASGRSASPPGAPVATSANPVRPSSSPGPSSSGAARPSTAAPSPPADCPANQPYPSGVGAAVDYVNFVHLNGTTYLARGGGVRASAATRAELGPIAGHVNCTLEDLQQGGRQVLGAWKDGTASFVPVGSPIYQVPGYPRTCRVAAVLDGTIYQFLAQDETARVATALPCATRPSK